MKKHPEITAQTKKNIMDAFWDIYCVKRIESITIKEITDKAGYNRSTFYEYFKDVYDVLEQLERLILPDLSSHRDLDYLDESDLSKHLHQFVEAHKGYQNYYRVLLSSSGDLYFQYKMKEVFRPLLKMYFAYLGDNDTFTQDYKVKFALSGFIMALCYGYGQENIPDMEQRVRLLWQFICNGIIKRME